jgi:hypothetical protein
LLFDDPDFACADLLKTTAAALRAATLPELSEEGTGATYIISDENLHPVAVFKPADEEAFAP